MDEKILKSSAEFLACLVIDFGWVLIGFLDLFSKRKMIFPNYSSLRGDAISVSFPEVRIRKEAEIGLRVQQYTRFDVDDGDEDGDDNIRDDNDDVDDG